MAVGILALICASLILGSIPSANKYILLSGVSSGGIVFYSFLIVALGAALIILLTKKSLRVSMSQLVMLLVLGALGMGGTGFLLNLAYSFIPVGLATMLHFLYPSLVSIVMVVLFGQKMTYCKIGAIVISILGMFLIADLSGGIKLLGVIIALCSSCTYSFYMIGNEKGSINRLPLIVKLFYSSAGACIIFGIQSYTDLSIPHGSIVYLLLFGVCGLGSLLAFYLLTAGIKLIGASTASFFNMLEPVTSLVVSTLVYHDVPGIKTLLGCGLVLMSVLLVALDGVRKNC